ncbi:uncharacterized protein [Rutidosis leptorrhynchoides]|uniref:uncharacterized protein n=1 Tax=Rutidosis leptorrhynchoides TaxID=125765 RepID=UPI003A9975EB
MLSILNHENIVSIIGFCDEQNEKIVINKRCAKGSLLMHINKERLTWIQRFRICVGVARALHYMHDDDERSYSVIHRNINSSTILLDNNFVPRLSGFEYSVKHVVDQKEHVLLSNAIGTKVYMDPEITKNGGVTLKSDIYSFGIVLWEVLSGRKAFIPNEDEDKRFLASLVGSHFENYTLKYIIHPDLWNHLSQRSLSSFSNVAYYCIKNERVHRPYMQSIIHELQKALEFQVSFDNSGNKLKHLKFPVDELGDAIIHTTTSYRKNYDILDVEVRHFIRHDISSVEGKNKEGELPKRVKVVFMKRLSSRKERVAFLTEVKVLSNCNHRNIVTLLGIFANDDFDYLVIEHAPNGFLHNHLETIKNNPINLTWVKRLKISLDVANGLKYLHHEMDDQKVILIRSLASSIIGLDENWGAKIYFFENSMIVSRNQDEGVFKARGITETVYTDPEFVKNRIVSRGGDVYSFGVILFELLCGRVAYDPVFRKEDYDRALAYVARRRRFTEKTVMEMIDPIIKEGSTGDYKFTLSRGANKDSLETFIKIAYECLAETVDQRPTMKVVVEGLEKALLFQENIENNPRVSLEEITQATGNFHVSNLIGKGGFGKVYKGEIQKGDEFDTIVAKRLDKTSGQEEQQFQNELQVLFNYKHDNVIRLVGYCDEKDEKVIVYEYASRGSLNNYLNDTTNLTWIKRLNICIDVAATLEFLHGGVTTHVIHRDIKTENILLNYEWKAKLADFGLSLISAINQKTEYVIANECGTEGYVDPLYRKFGFLTMESDIYSFGVVLFEILYGKSTFWFRKHEGQFLPSFIKQRFEEGRHNEVVFEAIKEQIVPKALSAFQEISYRCLNDDRENRPTAKEVLEQLKKTLELQRNSGWPGEIKHDLPYAQDRQNGSPKLGFYA